MKNKVAHWFILSTFVGLYLVVSLISTVHVIEFFNLSNPSWLAISLAVAFEIGAAASLASLIIMERMNKFMVWMLFLVLTAMQAMGNTYYAYVHLHDFNSWSELFGLIDEDIIYQKRVLSIISGAILPFVALGFIKSLVDYIKPDLDKKEEDSEHKEVKIDLGTSESRETVKQDTQEQVPNSNETPSIEKVEEEPLKEPESTVSSEPSPAPPIVKTGGESEFWVNNNHPGNSIEDPVLRYHHGISQQ